MKFKRYTSVYLLFLFLFPFFLPAAHADESLQIKGSDTMVNLGQAWAEEFMVKNPHVSIAVTGGGSGTGIAAIIGGTCDIAQASRDITEEEIAKAKNAGREIKETVVGYDGIAVIVHPSNPITKLTIEQLSGIFTGQIKNWKELGGNDLPILPLSRERNSGTHVFFLEHVVRQGNAKGSEEFATSALMMPSSQAIVQEVQTSAEAIGYVGHGYINNQLKVVAISKAVEAEGILPTVKTVQSGEYPIARALHFLTSTSPKAETQDFINFVLSEEGQQIVLMLDFVPMKK